VLGLAGSAVSAAVAGLIASAAAAGITFGWLIPMTAMSAVALAAATLARSANVGVAAGLAAWCITVLSGQAAAGRPGAAVTDRSLFLPYLTVAVVCAALTLYATRIPRVTRTPRGSS